MPHNSSVVRYQDHLARLNYPEYAHRHVDDRQRNTAHGQGLNLSLWNEGLPPGVAEVAGNVLSKAVGTYSLAQDGELLALLAKRLGVSEDSVVITAGADDALRVLSQYCLRPGTRTLIPVPCFGRYAYHAKVHEAEIYYLRFGVYPYEFDVAQICDEIQKKNIKCLYIASPNNPTGHVLSRELIKQLLDKVNCAVILDESLLLPADTASNSDLVADYQNVFICGSFSKLYGLPGLRVGYLAASSVHAQRLRKLVSPFGVNAFGLEIAKHVLTQDDWLRQRAESIHSGIAALRSVDNQNFKVTRTSAPVALIQYTGSGSLYHMLREHNVTTVAGEEFSGLANANAVRVIIKDVQDMLQLKQILADIS